MLAWFETAFGDGPVWEVRKRVALQRALSAGESVFAYEESVDMEAVFMDNPTTLDRQFGHADPEKHEVTT